MYMYVAIQYIIILIKLYSQGNYHQLGIIGMMYVHAM